MLNDFTYSFENYISKHFDLTTFSGRYRYFWHICTDPFTLLNSTEYIRNAQKILQTNPKSVDNKSDISEFETVKIVLSSVHQDTREIIPWYFRRSAFIPTNLPLYAGMLYTPQTIPWIIFWQTSNQMYTVCLNYYNRNATNTRTESQMIQTFLCATTLSSSVGIASKILIQNIQTPKSWFWRGLIRSVVPTSAVITASATGVLSVRWNEIKEGVVIRDKPDVTGEKLGISLVAGKEGLCQTLMSRALIPISGLIIPSIMMHFIQRIGILNKYPRMMIPARFATVISGMCIGLPLSLSPFPQWSKLDVHKLEEDVRNKVISNGCREIVYHNRGL